LTTDSVITLTGTIVTLLGMSVAIRQASQARNYKNQIKFDIRKINLSGVIERLKRSQDEIRKLPTSTSIPRGIKANELILNIRSHFDFSLGILDASGPEKDIRLILGEAQQKLNSYETSWNNKNPSAENVFELQALIQDAVSQANSRIYLLEGKA